jgi:hypothetical protein
MYKPHEYSRQDFYCMFIEHESCILNYATFPVAAHRGDIKNEDWADPERAGGAGGPSDADDPGD